MTNENEMLAGAGLPPWFATGIAGLVEAIQAAARPGSDGSASRTATTHLTLIRSNAAGSSPDLYNALDTVRSAVKLFEGIVARPTIPMGDHARLVTDTREIAIGSLGVLVEVLRTVQPSAKARPRP